MFIDKRDKKIPSRSLREGIKQLKTNELEAVNLVFYHLKSY
jgi:hypothetical protein